MRPIKLWMTAFGPYAGTEVVDFRPATDAGLFGIYGPTGSGKSSVFSAMSFALFGEGARADQKARTMRSDHAPPTTATEVSLLFELGDKRYLVRRQPEQSRPKLRGEGETNEAHKAWLFDVSNVDVDAVTPEQGGTVLAETKVGAVNDRIGDLLNYGVEQFRQIVLLPQGKFEQFLLADSKERLSILRDLFDVSLYEQMTKRLAEQALAAQREVQIGIQVRQQRLAQANFNSTDELLTAIDDAQIDVVEKECASQRADTARAAAEGALSAGEALAKHFDELEAAQRALIDLETRKPEIERVAVRHNAACRAQKLIDLDEAVDRARRIKREADEVANQADEAARVANEARSSAEATFLNLKSRSAEIQDLKRRTVELERFGALLAGAADLKSTAEDAEESLKLLREVADKASADVERLTTETEQKRSQIADAQAIQVKRLELAGAHQMAQSAYSLAQVYESTLSKIEQAKTAELQARQAAEAANTACQVAEDEVAARRAKFVAGQAQLLAAQLAPGIPCPVCGSEEHPNPAHAGAGTSSDLEQAMREAEAAHRAAVEKVQDAVAQHRSALGLLNERKFALEQSSKPEHSAATIAARVSDLANRIEALGSPVDLEALHAASEKKSEELLAVQANQRVSAEELTNAERNAAASRRSYDDQIASVPDEHRDFAALGTVISDLQTEIDSREQALERAQSNLTAARESSAAADRDLANARTRVSQCVEEVTAAERAFDIRRKELGLSPDDFRMSRGEIDQIDTLASLMSDYSEAVLRATTRRDNARQETLGRERPALASLKATSESARSAFAEATRVHAAASAHYTSLVDLRDALASEFNRLAALEQETAPLREIAEAFNGQNPLRVDLETYAIGAMFDQTLQAANLRLDPMTQGRYRLERDTQSVGGRKRRGLDILVHDIQTGRAREVSTLSGGETFMAALALALGLSDVVEMSHGAIRLDTIFIDEGFGSLDSDGESGTLDQVLQVLQNIVGQRRAVGLISHVETVKVAVPCGFNIVKGTVGSRIEVRT